MRTTLRPVMSLTELSLVKPEVTSAGWVVRGRIGAGGDAAQQKYDHHAGGREHLGDAIGAASDDIRVRLLNGHERSRC